MAISLRAGPANKGTGNRQGTETGVPLLGLFKGLTFSVNPQRKKKTTHLAFPATFTSIVCLQCHVTLLRLCPLMCFGSRVLFLYCGFKWRLLTATLAFPHPPSQEVPLKAPGRVHGGAGRICEAIAAVSQA